MATIEKVCDKLDLARLHVEDVLTTLKNELSDYSKAQIRDEDCKDQLNRIEKLIKDLKKVII
jgi:hypothetical protein